MRGLLRKTHRYVGLTLAVFWGMQALTGVLMVFHWELEDASFERSSINLNQIGARVDALRSADARWTVTSVYPTGGMAGYFDVFLSNGSGQTDSVRVDGAGRVLERKPLDYDYRRAGLLRAATELHQSLFAGHRGRLIVGVSGLVLLGNLVLGIKLAWPRLNQWRGALRVPGGLRGAARLYAWHRALGLWFAIPAVILLVAGCCLAFDAQGFRHDDRVRFRRERRSARSRGRVACRRGQTIRRWLLSDPHRRGRRSHRQDRFVECRMLAGHHACARHFFVAAQGRITACFRRCIGANRRTGRRSDWHASRHLARRERHRTGIGPADGWLVGGLIHNDMHADRYRR
jgi:hypothetical protein